MGRARRTITGTVTGFVLRLARESIPRTEAALAQALGVDLDTVQGWESGRRPLANVRAGVLLEVRRRLPALGAEPRLVLWLDAAMDADRIIAAGLGHNAGGPHPLAGWVHTRDTAHMLAWALNGTTPPALAGRLPKARRGPVAASPQLPEAERVVFFEHLRDATEQAAGQGEAGALLHRQALYLASYDHGRDAAAWTAQTLHRRRDVSARRGWSPHWAEARSTHHARPARRPAAAAGLHRPRPGRRRPAEAANLNYWALWLGPLPVPQADDTFMLDRDLSGWDPVTLLRALASGLHVAPGYVDLYAHSLWALLTAFPWLPQAAGPLAAPLRERTVQLLDGVPLSSRSRRELDHVHYVFDHNR